MEESNQTFDLGSYRTTHHFKDNLDFNVARSHNSIEIINVLKTYYLPRRIMCVEG